MPSSSSPLHSSTLHSSVSDSSIKKPVIKKTAKKDVQIFKNGKNNILYPIFADCIRFTTDEFWKNLFEELSYGKCPKSIYISNSTIYSSNKRKGFSYIIPMDGIKTPKEVFVEIRELLMNNTAICSSIDVSIKKEELREKQDDEITNETTWSEIRKKNLREIFIVKYAVRMKKKHKLSWIAARHLYSLIQIGFIYKHQTSKDVNFRNRRIENIDGIEYDSELERFVNNFSENEPPKEKEEFEDNENYLYYYWDRFVSSMSKII